MRHYPKFDALVFWNFLPEPRYLQWETSSAKPPLPSGKVRKISDEKDNRDPEHSSVLVVQGLATAVNSGISSLISTHLFLVFGHLFTRVE